MSKLREYYLNDPDFEIKQPPLGKYAIYAGIVLGPREMLQQEIASSLPLAHDAASLGNTIVLLPPHPHHASPDAYLNEIGNALEFKLITSRNRDRAAEALKDADKKADHLWLKAENIALNDLVASFRGTLLMRNKKLGFLRLRMLFVQHKTGFTILEVADLIK